MRTTRTILRASAIVATTVGVIALVVPESDIGRFARRLRKRLTRDLRYVAASTPGLVYRLEGRRPDPNVSDDVLADRVRSSLGPLERRLDLPHVNVMVTDRIVILHGCVGSYADADRIELATLRVSGVEGVESHLHHGLTAGDSRPSEGVFSQPPSAALTSLLEAARSAGASDPESAVHAVLCGFGDRIPTGEYEQVLAHLPADVRELTTGPRSYGRSVARVHTVAELVAAVTAVGGIDADKAPAISGAVIGTLRTLVPEEVGDVAANLAPDVRELWLEGVPGGPKVPMT